MYNAKNNAQTTLSVSINNSVTSIDVVDASVFPSVPFVVTIESEILEVTNVVSNTLTVVRGHEGTVASSHLGGVSVEHRWTAGMYDALVDRGVDNPFPSMPYIGVSPIIESGSNTDGKYVKYEDGTMIQYLNPVVEILSGTNLSVETTIPLPTPFFDTNYQWVATQGALHGNYIAATCIYGQASAKNVDGFLLFAFTPAGSIGSTFNPNPNIIAVGRWKA